jgi:tripartite-type tricarboxylate transporter receptor subunit TctC
MIDASRRRVLAGSAGLAAVSLGGRARAQSTYPNRPVKLVVPYAPGGGPDLQARKLGPELAKALGGNVVVENRIGAGGIVAGEVVAQQPPDGYSVLIGSATHIINKVMQPAIKFDPLRSFDPVTAIATSGTILVVTVDSPYRSAQDLVAAIKARPSAFNYGSGGVGTAAHLAGGALCKVVGLDAVHVPFRGSVEIVPGMLGGQVQFALPIAGTAMTGIQQGKVRPLAVSTPQRMRQLPDVPTLRELFGSELLVQESWSGFWVPAGTPRETIDRLFEATHRAHDTAPVREFYAQTGTDVLLSKSPQQFAEFMRAETEKWARVISLLEIKPS